MTLGREEFTTLKIERGAVHNLDTRETGEVHNLDTRARGRIHNLDTRGERRRREGGGDCSPFKLLDLLLLKHRNGKKRMLI